MISYYVGSSDLYARRGQFSSYLTQLQNINLRLDHVEENFLHLMVFFYF